VSFIVRELQFRDFEGIVQICRELMSPSFHWPKEKIWGQLEDTTTKTFVAVQDPEVLAFVSLMELGPAVEIPVLGTAKKYQHQGVMKALLSQVFAAQYASRELWLEVHENNEQARNLYRTLGFVESGRRENYYQDSAAAILCNLFPKKN